MKTLGLIGGTSWLSSADYYRIINQSISKRLGGLNSAKLILYSINFAEKKIYLDRNDWDTISEMYCDIAKKLQNAGADCVLLCANTPHNIAHDIQKAIQIPFIHIAEETTKEISKQHLKTVGLLGTKFTMEQKFFTDKLAQQQISTVVPDDADRDFIHASIFDELGKEIFSHKTKSRYLDIINKLIDKGAQGVIFGCTEIPLLIKPEDCSIPTFDTTLIHTNAAVEFALSDEVVLR